MRNTSSLFAVAAVIAIALVACREPPPENTGGCTEAWFEEIIRDDAPEAVGDLSCFEAGSLSDSPADAACQSDVTLDATVVDYQEQEPVADVTLSLFGSDDPDASGGDELTSDADGAAEATVQACTPFAYKASRADAMDTYGPHVVVGHETPIEKNFQSVSNGSRSIIELGLQIEISDGNGAVVGLVRGCDEEPLLGAQVIVRDADCQVPASWVPGYFSNQIPDAFRAETSDDGVWAGMDVPPGEYVAEAYINTGDGLVLLASAPVQVRADSVTVADLHAGRSDGIKLPDSCTGC
jgi:hypothetical protein